MASYNRQVIDINASAGMTTDQSNEHQRKWSERGWKDAAKHGNYDPTRAKLNFEVTKGGIVQAIDTSISIPKRIKANLKARGIEDPNEELKRKGKEPNRRTVVNIIFGGSRERMHEIAYGNQKVDLTHGADNSHITRSPDIEQWAKDIYKFACDKWGEENIVGFYVHLDEMNPHAHCTLLPITQRNKFSFKELFAGKDKAEFTVRTRQLHDELAVVNQRWGLDRGNDKLETGARHRTTEEYRRKLRKECNDLELEIKDKHETLRDLYADINKATKRCKGLTTMVKNLEQKESELTTELTHLQAEVNAGTGNAADLYRRIAELENKLRVTTSSLVDKRQKLKDADRQLAVLNSEMDAVKQNTSNLQRQRDEYTQDVKTQVRMRLTDSVFAKYTVEFRRILEMLTPEQKAQFGNDFFVHLAEKPGDIMQCAMLLFIGYIDGAIQFAKGSGGGGSTSDLKWGRDPNEDDRKFAFRCMMQAHRMMRPTPNKQIKRK